MKGQDPKYWGPVAWVTLHASTREFDRMDSGGGTLCGSGDSPRDFLEWLEVFPHLLPCSTCRTHAVSFAKRVALTMGDVTRQFSCAEVVETRSTFRWGHALHNLVNDRLELPRMPLARAVRVWSRPTGSDAPRSSAWEYMAAANFLTRVMVNYDNHSYPAAEKRAIYTRLVNVIPWLLLFLSPTSGSRCPEPIARPRAPLSSQVLLTWLSGVFDHLREQSGIYARCSVKDAVVRCADEYGAGDCAEGETTCRSLARSI